MSGGVPSKGNLSVGRRRFRDPVPVHQLKPRVASGPSQQPAPWKGSHPGTAGSIGVSSEVWHTQPRDLAGPLWKGLCDLQGCSSTSRQSCRALVSVTALGSREGRKGKKNRAFPPYCHNVDLADRLWKKNGLQTSP